MIWDHAEYDLRCEWGLAGVRALAPIGDVLIVVDVLVFSTAVDIAVTRGASVLPHRWRDSSAEAFAKSKGALLASPRSAGGYSLSPPMRAPAVRASPSFQPESSGATARFVPPFEDLIGAGAVLANLPGRPSPEAETAIAAFERFHHNLHDALARSTSGKELVERGFAYDVQVAAEYAASTAAPVMFEARFVNAATD